MSSTVLGCRNVSKRFGETQALNDVSVDFLAGHLHSILGENGSGKSTLAKALSGVLPVDNGSITVGGARVDGAPDPRAMLARGVAIVLQEVLIVPNRSVAENILLGQDGVFRRSIPRTDKTARARAVLERLTDRNIPMEVPAGDLPLHEQQIVVIARGFARNPDVLILDEATAALDLADRSKLFDALRTFCATGGCVVFVTHRMPEIIELSDHTHLMQNGRLVGQLSGDEINAKRLIDYLAREHADA